MSVFDTMEGTVITLSTLPVSYIRASGVFVVFAVRVCQSISLFQHTKGHNKKKKSDNVGQIGNIKVQLAAGYQMQISKISVFGENNQI